MADSQTLLDEEATVTGDHHSFFLGGFQAVGKLVQWEVVLWVQPVESAGD